MKKILLLGLIFLSIISNAGYGVMVLDVEKWTPGSAWNGDSYEEMTKIAMKYCKSKGGENCKVVAKFEDECNTLSYSKDEKVYGVSVGVIRENSINNSLLECKNKGGKDCKVIFHTCMLDLAY